MKRAAFVYEPALSQNPLHSDHPLQPSRLQYTYELLEAYGAFQNSASQVVPPRQAGVELLTFHTPEYVEAVKGLSQGNGRFNPVAFNFSTRGDNRPYPGMYEASSLAVGASLVAAEELVQGKVDVAFNVSGGLHHAAPNYASGFCVFNDVVIAIKYLLSQGVRVAYIDIDAHHGDGVQYAFYNSHRVLTISIHEWGRYLFPGTGDVAELGSGDAKGYSVNLPLAPFTDDEIYLWAFREIVPPLVSAFAPDMIVAQLGCDSHYLDPLTHLSLTTQGYSQVVKESALLAPRCLALGGGGYEMGVVPRAWTLAYGVMSEQDFPDEIPQEYGERYGLKRLRDDRGPELSSTSKEQARRFAQRRVEEVKKLVFPFHSL